MKSKSTLLWFVLAAALAALVWILQHQFPTTAPERLHFLRGLRAADVTAIQIIPAGTREISVVRTNQLWHLEKPLTYPAQGSAIESLLEAVEKISPQRLGADDLRGRNLDAEFGFANPQFSLVITAGEQTWQVRVGSRTAPGDQVFVRIVGLDGAFVTDTAWLQLLPHTANDWRDTTLVSSAENADWLIVTNAAKGITMEFCRDATNHLWRMLRPLAARADNARINTALQQLRSAHVSRFVTDDAKADLTTFGLQPPEISLWLGHGTNFITALHAGKKSVDQPGQMFARREGLPAIVTTADDALAAWQGFAYEFREARLFDFTAPVAEVEVDGENHFTLQRQNSDHWILAGEKFPVDAEKAQAFWRQLADWHAAAFEKDTSTAVDLQGFGLATPAKKITLRALAGDTNSVLAELLLGATTTNKVFAKRADEPFVYALAPESVDSLAVSSWSFRDRRIWNFSETNVVRVTLHQGGKTRQYLRAGTNKWTAAGTPGNVDAVGLEQSFQMLGNLAVVGWVARNPAEPEKLGFRPENLQLIVELKSGEKLTLDFGLEFSQTALIAATLEGERWVGALPRTLYTVVATYLTIPAGTP